MTLEPPVFVTVSESELLFPTATLPKLRLVGFDPSEPCDTPVPDSGMFTVGLDALDVIVMLPATVPEEVGEKMTLKLTL